MPGPSHTPDGPRGLGSSSSAPAGNAAEALAIAEALVEWGGRELERGDEGEGFHFLKVRSRCCFMKAAVFATTWSSVGRGSAS